MKEYSVCIEFFVKDKKTNSFVTTRETCRQVVPVTPTTYKFCVFSNPYEKPYLAFAEVEHNFKGIEKYLREKGYEVALVHNFIISKDVLAEEFNHYLLNHIDVSKFPRTARQIALEFLNTEESLVYKKAWVKSKNTDVEARMILSFSEVFTTGGLKYGAPIDIPKIIHQLDTRFCKEIKSMNIQPGLYRMFWRGFEYRSLPNWTPVDEVSDFLENDLVW